MDYIEKIKSKAQSQKQKASQVIGQLIILNKNNIFEDVKRRWKIGESSLGGIIGEYSNSPLGQEYKSYKMSINPSAGGNVDLTLTGALGRGLTIKKINSTDYKLFSTDSKYEMLGDKYGFDEFGLSESEWLEMQSELLVFALENAIKLTYE